MNFLRGLQGGLVLVLLSCTAAGAADKTVDVPCVPDGTKKEDRRPDQLGLRFCSVADADITQRAQTTLQKQVDQYYRGCKVDPKAPYNPDPKACPGVITPTQVCDIYPGTFNSGATEGPLGFDNNHMGDSCGSWSSFTTKLKDATCTVTPDHTGSNYTREDGMTRGMWVHAVGCHWEQVKHEIARNQLKLTSVGGVDGPCAVMSGDFEEKKKTADQQAKAFQVALGQRKNIDDIDNCNGTVTSQFVDNPDVGKLRQSACQLSATRAVLEGMLTYLAVCEVFSRAERSYQEFLASAGSKQIFYSAVQPALNKCVGQQRGEKSCNPSAVFSECYYPQFLAFLKGRAEAIWTPAVCQ